MQLMPQHGEVTAGDAVDGLRPLRMYETICDTRPTLLAASLPLLLPMTAPAR